MRDLTTCEDYGTEVITKRTGKVTGTIVGSYIGGFQVKAVSDGAICMLPFESISKFGVKE